MVFDDACILWTETCDGKGACLEYNIERLPFVFFGVSLGIKCLSYIFIALMFIAAWWTAKKTKEHTISAVDGYSNAAYENGDNGGLDTPQSDVTVSTILSSYSLNTESTQL